LALLFLRNQNLATWFDGGDGDDLFAGGLGNDILWGGIGNDLISGGNHGDAIYAGDGRDSVAGDDGDDVIVVRGQVDSAFEPYDTAPDLARGGIGSDIILFSSARGGTAWGDEGNDTIEGAQYYGWQLSTIFGGIGRIT
jgi:Ca2+-binding RTX toxin-like protein